jgi:aryl-alcohol dehydrogenase-like predicted oxidoreductase
MNSKLTLGTAQFGLDYGVANKSGKIDFLNAKKIIDFAKKNGISTLDTASAYGKSEKLLGEIGIRDFEIITKLPKIPNEIKSVDEWFEENFYKSLERLKINSLSTLMVHNVSDILHEHGSALIKLLEKAKEDLLINKVGISIYSPYDLDSILNIYNFDVIQAPLNPLDTRLIESGWMDRLPQKNIDIHIRSIFLQGLLLMPYKDIPSKFNIFKHKLKEWHQWNDQNKIKPLETCIRFANSFDNVSKIIFGVDSLSQLSEIYKLSKVKNKKIQDLDIATNDDILIDPSRWSSL